MEIKLQFAAQLAVAVIFRQQLQPPCKLITHFNTTENLHIPHPPHHHHFSFFWLPDKHPCHF